MTIKSSIFYWVVCDNCGVRPYWAARRLLALRARNDAETKAVDRGWTTDNHGHHYCWACGPPKERPLKEPAPPAELAP